MTHQPKGVGDDSSSAEESCEESGEGSNRCGTGEGGLAKAVAPPVASSDKLVLQEQEAQERGRLAMQALSMLDAFVETRRPAR